MKQNLSENEGENFLLLALGYLCIVSVQQIEINYFGYSTRAHSFRFSSFHLFPFAVLFVLFYGSPFPTLHIHKFTLQLISLRLVTTTYSQRNVESFSHRLEKLRMSFFIRKSILVRDSSVRTYIHTHTRGLCNKYENCTGFICIYTFFPCLFCLPKKKE